MQRAMSPELNVEWRAEFTNREIIDLHAEAFGPDDPHTPERDWLRQVHAHSLGWVVARDANERVVGFVNVLWDGLTHAFIEDVMVDAQHRHGGIGVMVVHMARDNAKAAGCRYLHVGFDQRLSPFYVDACGFTATGGGLMELDAATSS